MLERSESMFWSLRSPQPLVLSDLLAHEIDEAPGAPLDDVVEVSNYVAAVAHGLERMRRGFPLSLRLLREIHGVLLAEGRGADRDPGEFRRSQNWIGGPRPGNARYVPPPPDRLLECTGDLEKFLHDQPNRTPLLIKAALAHVQFETIHPFLEGNGQFGRLLITLLLCAEEALSEPILYLSLHLKTHRDEYYEWCEPEGFLEVCTLDGEQKIACADVATPEGFLPGLALEPCSGCSETPEGVECE